MWILLSWLSGLDVHCLIQKRDNAFTFKYIVQKIHKSAINFMTPPLSILFSVCHVACVPRYVSLVSLGYLRL